MLPVRIVVSSSFQEAGPGAGVWKGTPGTFLECKQCLDLGVGYMGMFDL